MVTSITERKEILVVTENRDWVLKIRDEITKKFPRTWVFVHKDNNLYGIEVANVWGGALPDDKVAEIKKLTSHPMYAKKGKK